MPLLSEPETCAIDTTALLDALTIRRNAVYRDGLTVEAALQQLDELAVECPEVSIFIDSLRASTRGIAR